MKRGNARERYWLGRLDTETDTELENTNPFVNVVRALAGHNEELPFAAFGWQAREGKSFTFSSAHFLAAERKLCESYIKRCCALDVHKKSITASVLVGDGEAAVQERKKEFGTTRKELEKLRFWLMASKVSVAAMESAGVYWKPVWHAGEAEEISAEAGQRAALSWR